MAKECTVYIPPEDPVHMIMKYGIYNTSRNASIVGRAYFRLYTHAQEQDARVLWTCCRVAQPCFSSLLGVHVATLRQVDL